MMRMGVLSGLLLAGCAAEVPEGARLTVTVVGDARADLAGRLVAEATRPTLVARDGAGQSVAGLASSWRFVDDGRSLILRLAPDKWSDGTDLEAKAVVAAFRRAARGREPAIGWAGIAKADDVAARRLGVARLGVLAPIARVVELRLDSPSPLLLGWLAEPGLGVTSGDGKATLAAYDVSGPATRRVLKRRTMVARADARPAEIIVGVSADPAAAIAGFGRGESDIVVGAGLAGLGAARVAGRADALRIDPVWGVYGYVANTKRGPLADPRVRLALALAVDRVPLVQSFGLAAIAPAAGLLPPSLVPPPARPASRSGLAGAVARLGSELALVPDAPSMGDWLARPTAERLVEAGRLLAAAGHDGATPLRLVVLLPAGRDHRRVAERVGADWARVGVLLAVTEIGGEALDRLVAKGDFDLALTEASIAVPDAGVLLARFGCTAGLHCDPAADALLAEARAATPGARPALLARAEAVMMAAPPMIPLFTPVRWALVGRQVDGWVPNRSGSHPLARLAIK